MEFAKVNVDVRSAAKKGGARKVRSGGAVPGVLYGRKREPLAVTFNEKELVNSLDKEKRRNTVLTLTSPATARARRKRSRRWCATRRSTRSAGASCTSTSWPST
jgi:ribosomal protein L25 (general stress protein Ctc)